MKRFPPIADAEFTPAQHRMASKAQASGPFHAYLRAPELWEAIQPCRAYLTAKSVLSAAAREAAILAIAQHWRSGTALEAHSKLAEQAGLTQSAIAAIINSQIVDAPANDVRIALACTRALLRDNSINDALYDDARRVLGERGIVELAALVGFYTTICLTLNMGEPDSVNTS